MALELESFADDALDEDYLLHLIDQQSIDAVRYARLWDYFRNPLMGHGSGSVLNASSRPYFQAQEIGLPARITGVLRGGAASNGTDIRRKEVVIENDIAWRIHTMIDFLFGKAPSVRSKAADPALASTIESLVAALMEANGGQAFFQELSLLGCVYGFVDIALRIPAQGSLATWPDPLPPRDADRSAPLATSADDAAGPGTSTSPNAAGSAGDRSRTLLSRALRRIRQITLETVEAPRVLPILDDDDYRTTRYWIQRYHKHPARMSGRRRRWMGLPSLRRELVPAEVEVIEIISSQWWQRYEDRELVAEGPNSLARLPIVHVQNIAMPGSYEGLSDVEPMLSLQDELNTRLSDRASRVTYQAFKMYLGKGIDDFLERPVGPGQMWATQNLSATVEEFGSDEGSPSEDAHIAQVRQALDKVSGVTSLSAGLIAGNVGNLTSATALKVLLSGLLAKTDKKRLTYGAGLSAAVELALAYLDHEGLLPTAPQDRGIEIHWPSPLPADEGEQLRNAQIKAQLGVPTERILAELGYDRTAANCQ